MGGAELTAPTAGVPRLPGLPLLGSALDANTDPCRFFHRAYERMGPVFEVAYPGQVLTLLAGPEANQLFAKEGGRLFDVVRTYARVTREMGTNQLPNVQEGEAHKQMRRALAPSLSAQAVAPYVPTLFALAGDRARSWPEGRRFHARTALEPLTLDLVGTATAHRTVGPKLTRDIRLYATLMGAIGVGAAGPEGLLYLPPVQRARQRFARHVDALVAEHRAFRGEREPDAIDAILRMEEAYPGRLDAKAIQALAMQPLKNAGIYLYRMLSFALWEVLRDPELEARVRQEIEGACASGPPTAEALRSLPTLQGVLYEALRLYPMAIALPRVVREAFVFEGHTFEPGRTVYIAGPVTHYLPQFFRDPLRFDPDRYGPGRNEHRQAHAWVPFGQGEHSCMARGFSTLIASTLLAGVLTARTLRTPTRALAIRAFPNPIPEASFQIVPGPAPTPAGARPVSRAPVFDLEQALGALIPETRARIEADIREEHFAAGAVLFRQGDEPDRFHLIRSGVAVVAVDGREVARLGAGQHVGEIGVVQGVPRTATVRASSAQELLTLSIGAVAFRDLVIEADLTSGELAKLLQKRARKTQLAQAIPGLDVGALSAVVASCALEDFAPGQDIVRQGEPAQRFYVLTRGSAAVLNTSPGGEPIEIATLRAPDVFGEVGLIESGTRTATVRASAEGATCLTLSAAEFKALVAGSEGAREDLAHLATSRLFGLKSR